jgi:uncharacterized protein YsxB (DUF464 family)
VTNITLFWGEKGLAGLESRGHSGGGCKGEDVVCAAVSAVIQLLLVGLRDVAGLSEAEDTWDRSIPLIRVKWPERKIPEVDLLTRTVAFSLKEMASRYAEYVRITEVRVS